MTTPVPLGREDARFVDRMGRLFEVEGIPRTAGRLVGLMLLEVEARTLDELAARIRVSKASVSTNARLLDRWGVLERTTQPGDRRDFYRLADDFQSRLVDRRLEHLARVRALIQQGGRTDAAADPRVAERLRRVDRLTACAAEDLARRAKALRAELGGEAGR